jgi:F-type H+-transporting ATPase subunit beta
MEELRSLVIAAQSGDHEAFGVIVTRFQNMAYAGAYALLGDSGLAQDAAQEAFIDAYLSLNKLREPAAFPGWFRRILLKHSDRLIRGKRVPTIPLEEAQEFPSSLPDPALVVERWQVQQIIQAAIAALPQNQRMVTTLFYVNDYSQREIAQFLELPVTTIKKRLYTARQSLKERIIVMLQEHLQGNKPSQSDHFADKVQFFIALRANDLAQVRKLVMKDPRLVHLKTTWDVSSQGYYWPLGVTPLFWAASSGNIELANFLISQGAEVNTSDPAGATPLHHAINMRKVELVGLLLKAGAKVNAETHLGQTPLHLAVLKNSPESAELLLSYKAALNAVDKRGYTPMDWAILKGYSPLVELLIAHGAAKSRHVEMKHPIKVVGQDQKRRHGPVGPGLLGRLVDGAGQPVDDQPPLTDVSLQPIYSSMGSVRSPILETGIKLIDLLAPLKRGGHIGLFSPLSGVGITLTLSDLIYSVATFHEGYIVYLGLEEGDYTAKSLVWAWQGECGLPEDILAQKMVHVFGKTDDPLEKQQQVVETGLTIAEDFRRQGRDVLVVLDGKLAGIDGVAPYLRANVVSAPEAAITTLYEGNYTVGLEPASLAGLDAVITFEMERALQKLSPAIDPLRSYSRLLQTDWVGAAHVQTANQVRKLFQRYHDLHYQVERYGLGSLWYLQTRTEDEQIANRARRLHRFLTQPLASAEAWANIKMMEGLIGIPSQYVSLEDTLAGCQAILAGEYDSLPEEAFYFVGTIEQVIQKAQFSE